VGAASVVLSEQSLAQLSSRAGAERSS